MLLTRLGTGDLPTLRCRVAPTGRWACQRYGRLWHDSRPPGRRWYELTDDDGPTSARGCFSFASLTVRGHSRLALLSTGGVVPPE